MSVVEKQDLKNRFPAIRNEKEKQAEGQAGVAGKETRAAIFTKTKRL